MFFFPLRPSVPWGPTHARYARYAPARAEGADLTWADGDGLTALHWAGRLGHSSVLETLLAKGADPKGLEGGVVCFFFVSF